MIPGLTGIIIDVALFKGGPNYLYAGFLTGILSFLIVTLRQFSRRVSALKFVVDLGIFAAFTGLLIYLSTQLLSPSYWQFRARIETLTSFPEPASCDFDPSSPEYVEGACSGMTFHDIESVSNLWTWLTAFAAASGVNSGDSHGSFMPTHRRGGQAAANIDAG